MFPIGMFPVGMFPATMFPPGGATQQAVPVIPLPSVGGFDKEDKENTYLDSYELEDERIIIEMVKLFLKGQR